jgi:GT2 family glycosyltransferase
MPADAIARLLAIEDFARNLRWLRRRRDREQSYRRVADEHLLPLVSDALVDEEWGKVAGDRAHALCRLLGLGEPAASARRSETAAPHVDVSPSRRVSVVILTMLGPTHLPACLSSLAEMNHPREDVEVLVVDNASAEDPTAVVAQHYPGARVLRQARNLGFCRGNNVGAAAARYEWLLFLNDDTRVEPDLLRAMFATAARRTAQSVGALVVDWDGREVDFAGGLVNFEGRGFQYGVGATDLARWRRDRPLLFANGAAMLIRKDVYLAAGGLPDRYFAYYEDVALGWALWLRGHEVWLSGDALVFHRHHGSSSQTRHAARERNFSRNALYTLTTHMDDESLPDVLSAALLMSATRMVFDLDAGGFRQDALTIGPPRRVPPSDLLNPVTLVDHARGELRRRGAKQVHGLFGSVRRVGIVGVAASIGAALRFMRLGTTASATSPAAASYRVPSSTAAVLAGIAEWALSSAESIAARDALQAARRRSDAAVLGPFAENWLSPVPVEQDRHAEYARTQRAIVEEFQLARFIRRRH